MNIDNLFSIILGLPKTIYVNFKYLKFKKAIKLPIFISHRVRLLSTKGSINIEGTIRTGMIRIGFGNVSIFDKRTSKSIFRNDGNITFKGTANIGHGSKLCVAGDLFIGNKFEITAETAIVCAQKVIIGDNCLLSWDNLIMDTDFHKIKELNGDIINANKEVIIGNNVWIGCRCLILKGSVIGDNNVVAANTCITGEYEGNNQIIGGYPVRILKKDIIWEK